jgi:hypothetical protein
LIPHIHVKSLCCGKANIYYIGVCTLKIADLVNADTFTTYNNILSKQEFSRGKVKKIIFCFLHNVIKVHKKQKIAIAALIKVED